MSAETWRPIASAPGYEVSDQGRVRSWLPWRGGPVPRILQAGTSRKGYKHVNLATWPGQPTRQIHVLVLRAFVGERPPGQETRHLNADRADNRLVNLAYGTARENQRDVLEHGHNANANKSCCPKGHRYDEDNTYVLPSRPTARYCRTCRADDSRRRRAARQGAAA